jgi:hypothetical protein
MDLHIGGSRNGASFTPVGPWCKSNHVQVAFALFAFFAVYDFPEAATFLTPEERAFIVFRLRHQEKLQEKSPEDSRVDVPETEEFRWAYVWDAFKDWQIYATVIVYWGVSNSPCGVFQREYNADSPYLLDRVPSVRDFAFPPNHNQEFGL